MKKFLLPIFLGLFTYNTYSQPTPNMRPNLSEDNDKILTTTNIDYASGTFIVMPDTFFLPSFANIYVQTTTTPELLYETGPTGSVQYTIPINSAAIDSNGYHAIHLRVTPAPALAPKDEDYFKPFTTTTYLQPGKNTAHILQPNISDGKLEDKL